MYDVLLALILSYGRALHAPSRRGASLINPGSGEFGNYFVLEGIYPPFCLFNLIKQTLHGCLDSALWMIDSTRSSKADAVSSITVDVPSTHTLDPRGSSLPWMTQSGGR